MLGEERAWILVALKTALMPHVLQKRAGLLWSNHWWSKTRCQYSCWSEKGNTLTCCAVRVGIVHVYIIIALWYSWKSQFHAQLSDAISANIDRLSFKQEKTAICISGTEKISFSVQHDLTPYFWCLNILQNLANRFVFCHVFHLPYWTVTGPFSVKLLIKVSMQVREGPIK